MFRFKKGYSLLLSAFAVLTLAGCSHRFASLPETQEPSCGYQQVVFAQFERCLKQELDEANPHSDQIVTDFETGLDGIEASCEAGQINDQEAFKKYRALQSEFVRKEESHNKTVKTVAAVAAVGVAAGGAAYAISRSNGGGGGGYSAPNTDYQGCCSWHNGINYCEAGSHRLVCKDGQYSPSCHC